MKNSLIFITDQGHGVRETEETATLIDKVAHLQPVCNVMY